MLEIKLTKIHKTAELSPNSIYKYTNLVDVIMPQNRMLLSDVEKLSELGAEIIAFDSTMRERPYSIKSLISKIHSCKRIAMADCSTIKDAIIAFENGADILSTTLSGYTNKKLPPKYPDFKLLNQLIKKFNIPIIAEGRFNTPILYKKAINLGAHAVVVGTALNRIELITKSFLDEV